MNSENEQRALTLLKAFLGGSRGYTVHDPHLGYGVEQYYAADPALVKRAVEILKSAESDERARERLSQECKAEAGLVDQLIPLRRKD